MRFERAILVVGAAAALLFVLLGIEAFGRPLNLPILIRHALLGGLDAVRRVNSVLRVIGDEG